jgi:hypothetical protein
MPLFIDVHHDVARGMNAEAVAEAHARDLAVQAKHGVEFIRYWWDEATGKAFCMSRAPSKAAHIAVHQEAHGIGVDEIYEVKEGV